MGANVCGFCQGRLVNNRAGVTVCEDCGMPYMTPAEWECWQAGHLADELLATKLDGTPVYHCLHCGAVWEVQGNDRENDNQD